MKYCVFVDVLGYGSIVTDQNRTENQKLNILNEIYSNLAANMLVDINEANTNAIDPIYVKSFSDCFYLESEEVKLILHAVKNIFRNAFTFYSSDFDSDFEYTALIRSGITRNWTKRFNDLASVVDKNQTYNPVGLGVAESYYLSEKTFLSGMRIIINETVFNQIEVESLNIDNKTFYKYTYDLNGVTYTSYFRKIVRNEMFFKVPVYELIWTFDTMNTCTTDGIDILKKIKPNFSKSTIRHYKKTAELLYLGLILTDCKERLGEQYQEKLNYLKKEMKLSYWHKLKYFTQQWLKLH